MDSGLESIFHSVHLEEDYFKTIAQQRQEELVKETIMSETTIPNNGHFYVVQWLYDHRAEGRTTNVMDYVAQPPGHFQVVQFLHENRETEVMLPPTEDENILKAFGHLFLFYTGAFITYTVLAYVNGDEIVRNSVNQSTSKPVYKESGSFSAKLVIE